MCGRYFLSSPVNRVVDQFVIREFFEDEGSGLIASMIGRYNIAPSQQVAVVRATGGGGGRELLGMGWGLVPGWSKGAGRGPRPINARSEEAAAKPYFRAAMRERRCLIPADGFYEWKKIGSGARGAKQPYAIGLVDGGLFGMAGLWEQWSGPEGELTTCTILTTSANELVGEIHDRMPVMIEPVDYERWLNPQIRRAEDVSDLLRPYPAERMRAVAVSRRVNSPAHDDARCLERDEGGLFG